MSWPAKNDKTRNSRFYDLRIDEEVYTSLETVNNSSTIEFILGCCQSLSLDKNRIKITRYHHGLVFEP